GMEGGVPLFRGGTAPLSPPPRRAPGSALGAVPRGVLPSALWTHGPAKRRDLGTRAERPHRTTALHRSLTNRHSSVTRAGRRRDCCLMIDSVGNAASDTGNSLARRRGTPG